MDLGYSVSRNGRSELNSGSPLEPDSYFSVSQLHPFAKLWQCSRRDRRTRSLVGALPSAELNFENASFTS